MIEKIAYDTSIVLVLHPHEKMHTSHCNCFTHGSQGTKNLWKQKFPPVLSAWIAQTFMELGPK
jgi:hypothetical protein